MGAQGLDGGDEFESMIKNNIDDYKLKMTKAI